MAYKDGFVIEYTHQGGRVSCYKCVFFDKSDKSCGKTGVYVPDVAYEKWKRCAYFELDSDWGTDEMRAKAARARALAQGKKKQKKSKSKGDGAGQKKKQSVAGVKQYASSGKTGNNGGRVKKSVARQHSRSRSANAKLMGRKVTSPKYGRGKVVGVEGDWVTVAFAKDSKRIRFKVFDAGEGTGLHF